MKIVSLSPAITEILFTLNASDQIAGNTYLCDFPREAKKIAKIGSFSNIDFEKIKNLKPDLVIASTIVQKRIFTYLISKGINTIYIDPRSIYAIVESIKSIGKLINREKETDTVIKKMQTKIADLKNNQPKNKPRIYIEEWYDPPMYSGNWVPDIVDIAGGIYGLAKKGDISRKTSSKKLIEFDPEFIFVSYCGFGKNSDPNKVLYRKGWDKITAVKNKKVFALNETILNRPGPRIIDSVKEIQNIILGN